VDKFQVFLALLATILTLTFGLLARTVLTSRAWWFLFGALLMLFCGVVLRFLPPALIGLTLLLWFAWEWLLFALRAATVRRQLRVAREIWDKRGPVTTLWSGETFEVRVSLCLAANEETLLGQLGVSGALPHVAMRDRLPFDVELIAANDSDLALDGPVNGARSLALNYSIRCGPVGHVRFEGVRIQLADLQGFFFHASFVHSPVVLPVLPRLVDRDPQGTMTKRFNMLPPPGTHRLHSPGSGSELLDLRDYLPGDPPRTIAWKVSARRGKLITKEFESEVPIRCTLFVDTSTSVRIPSKQGKALHRLIEIAAAVMQANAGVRDLTGLCLCDERGATVVRPDRNSNHYTRLLRLLTDAASLTPATRHVEPDKLLSLAYAFAEEVYPDLLRPAVNGMPFWLTWFASFPGYWRRRVSLAAFLHRRKLKLLGLSAFGVPFLFFLINVLLWKTLSPQERGILIVLSLLLMSLFQIGTSILLTLTLLISGRQRRLAAWRKRLAALLSVRYGLLPGGLEAMLEDDDLFSLHVQHFLNDHQVPFDLPLYDNNGRYLFAAPEKVAVLSRALLQAVSRGRDNELFVLLADLLELDDHLEPLLRAVRVALGRHHQVVLICPWPPGLAMPEAHPEPVDEAAELDRALRTTITDSVALHRLLTRSSVQGYHAAYQRVRRRFLRLGVPVVCAASDEPVPLVLDRVNRLRLVGRRR
jgi:uncharacterized protein (DUF58 family)